MGIFGQDGWYFLHHPFSEVSAAGLDSKLPAEANPK
jgi:hypothetical protein